MDLGSLLSGLTAGLASSFFLHPLDLLKTRSQVDEGLASRSLVHRARGIYISSGLLGFYRGVIPACLGAGLSWGLFFGIYDFTKATLYKSTSTSVVGSSPTLNFVGSTFSGCVVVFLTNPIWLIKTRLELQTHGNQHYSGTIQAAKRIVHEEGYLGLYKGVGPALILTSNGAIQFVIYEELKQRFIPSSDTEYRKASSGQGFSIQYFLMGALSKAIASSITYPYQVVKSRIQQRQVGKDFQYRNSFQTFSVIVRNEGVRGLYKGLFPNLLRVMPHSAITFVVYEFCKSVTM
mmetsp:Transcript_0/g.2  ORF Transcript_0/g.2 Transcript_0/m.2 type:complete len:291 (-) Transcript_0:1386-2258(-)